VADFLNGETSSPASHLFAFVRGVSATGAAAAAGLALVLVVVGLLGEVGRTNDRPRFGGSAVDADADVEARMEGSTVRLVFGEPENEREAASERSLEGEGANAKSWELEVEPFVAGFDSCPAAVSVAGGA